MSYMFNICEIYETIMGESGGAGWPCSLIRMGGCNLHCSYCDTDYARSDFKMFSLDEIGERIRTPYPRHVLVTGGEPLMQPGTPLLLEYLVKRGHTVYLETNGSLDIRGIDPRVVKVMDLKCPSSGESGKNLYENLDHLSHQDEVKFVIGDWEDFCWSKRILMMYPIQKKASVLFSPVYMRLEPRTLAEWILKDGMDVRFQIQIHKILWGEKRGI